MVIVDGRFMGASIPVMTPVDRSYEDWGILKQKERQSGSCSTLLSILFPSVLQDNRMYRRSLVRSASAVVDGVFAAPPVLFKKEMPERLETSRMLDRMAFFTVSASI